MKTRRHLLVLTAICWLAIALGPAVAKSPNVILALTDDQGYGDMGFAGNPIVPHATFGRDGIASAMLQNFYVSPA